MAVEILYDEERGRACFWCRCDGVAFGPVSRDDKSEYAQEKHERLERYLRLREVNPREVTDWDATRETFGQFCTYLMDEGLRFDDLADLSARHWLARFDEGCNG